MENKQDNEIHYLYQNNYRISNNLMGGVSFNLSLIINRKTNRVVGTGNISQATNPRLNIETNLVGDYSYMATMKSCNILVVADGYAPFAPLVMGAPQPIKNVTLRMSLEEDWKSGIAFYSYLINGQWVNVGPQKVEFIETPVEQTVENLAAAVKEEHAELPAHA